MRRSANGCSFMAVIHCDLYYFIQYKVHCVRFMRLSCHCTIYFVLSSYFIQKSPPSKTRRSHCAGLIDHVTRPIYRWKSLVFPPEEGAYTLLIKRQWCFHCNGILKHVPSYIFKKIIQAIEMIKSIFRSWTKIGHDSSPPLLWVTHSIPRCGFAFWIFGKKE